MLVQCWSLHWWDERSGHWCQCWDQWCQVGAGSTASSHQSEQLHYWPTLKQPAVINAGLTQNNAGLAQTTGLWRHSALITLATIISPTNQPSSDWGGVRWGKWFMPWLVSASDTFNFLMNQSILWWRLRSAAAQAWLCTVSQHQLLWAWLHSDFSWFLTGSLTDTWHWSAAAAPENASSLQQFLWSLSRFNTRCSSVKHLK